MGRGAGSPFFLLSYLAARRAGATDWYYGIRIGLDADGSRAIEYHHIHPQATLKKRFSKSEINDLANLAFISARANKKISNRSPERYFPELSARELERHFVPLDAALRIADAYPAFIRERRRLLAEAMTRFLDEFRPAFLSGSSSIETTKDRLMVTIHQPHPDQPQAIVEFCAVRPSGRWVGTATLAELERFLADIENGLMAGLPLNGDVVSVEGGMDTLEVPIGPSS